MLRRDCRPVFLSDDQVAVLNLRSFIGCPPRISFRSCPPQKTFRESRRSTRVSLKVVIAIEGGADTQMCDGETIVINLHGASIATGIRLSTGMRISIHVYVTD